MAPRVRAGTHGWVLETAGPQSMRGRKREKYDMNIVAFVLYIIRPYLCTLSFNKTISFLRYNQFLLRLVTWIESCPTSGKYTVLYSYDKIIKSYVRGIFFQTYEWRKHSYTDGLVGPRWGQWYCILV